MQAVEQMLQRYKYYSFQDKSRELSDFNSFCAKLKSAMQKDMKRKYKNLELVSWQPGDFNISGFIARKNDQAIFYFNFNDVRLYNVAGKQLYRSVKNIDDYKHGNNRYILAKDLLAAISKQN